MMNVGNLGCPKAAMSRSFVAPIKMVMFGFGIVHDWVGYPLVNKHSY